MSTAPQDERANADPEVSDPIPLSYHAPMPTPSRPALQAWPPIFRLDVWLVVSFCAIPLAGGHGVAVMGILAFGGWDHPLSFSLYTGVFLLFSAWLLHWPTPSAYVSVAGTLTLLGIWIWVIRRFDSIVCSASFSTPFLALVAWKLVVAFRALRRR